MADLADENSAALKLLGEATYPTGRKAVMYHPFAGIATDPDEVVLGVLFETLIDFSSLRLLGSFNADTSKLNPTSSDLVVTQQSQRNGGFGTDFNYTVHALVKDVFGITSEGASLPMSEKAGKLFTDEPRTSDFEKLGK